MPVTKLDSYYNKEEREEIIMAFQKKTWKDRITEFPTRRTLTKSDGSTELVTVARAEGTVSQEGDAFNAASMNDLEERISQANNDLNNSLSGIDIRVNNETGRPEWSSRGADTWSPFKSSFAEETKSATYARLNSGGDTIYFTFSHPVLGIKKITWSGGSIGTAQFVSDYSVSGNIVTLNTSKRGDYGTFPQNLTISITVIYEK